MPPMAMAAVPSPPARSSASCENARTMPPPMPSSAMASCVANLKPLSAKPPFSLEILVRLSESSASLPPRSNARPYWSTRPGISPMDSLTLAVPATTPSSSRVMMSSMGSISLALLAGPVQIFSELQLAAFFLFFRAAALSTLPDPEALDFEGMDFFKKALIYLQAERRGHGSDG